MPPLRLRLHPLFIPFRGEPPVVERHSGQRSAASPRDTVRAERAAGAVSDEVGRPVRILPVELKRLPALAECCEELRLGHLRRTEGDWQAERGTLGSPGSLRVWPWILRKKRKGEDLDCASR